MGSSMQMITHLYAVGERERYMRQWYVLHFSFHLYVEIFGLEQDQK